MLACYPGECSSARSSRYGRDPNAIIRAGIAGDDFPDVLATSRAFMELAAARGMKSALGPGQLSVGVGVDVRHSRPRR